MREGRGICRRVPACAGGVAACAHVVCDVCAPLATGCFVACLRAPPFRVGALRDPHGALLALDALAACDAVGVAHDAMAGVWFLFLSSHKMRARYARAARTASSGRG